MRRSLPVAASWQGRVIYRPESFVDQRRVLFQGGRGGNGALFFWKQASRQRRVPAGGSGGHGGSVKLRSSSRVSCLRHLHATHRAPPGANGSPKEKHGASGKDTLLDVPEGTLVWHCSHSSCTLLHDLRMPNRIVTAARGGRGGRGNMAFASRRGSSADISESGADGERTRLTLEMSSIADVGLVGIPNAGKSSLLQRISNAKPEAQPYQFTTLRCANLRACTVSPRKPLIGTVFVPENESPPTTRSLKACDLPGLLDGASHGKGLGFNFLRHVKRCNVLTAVVDLTAGLKDDTRQRPWQQLQMLRSELEAYQRGLSDKLALVIANKSDEAHTSRAARALKRRTNLPVATVSAFKESDFTDLKERLLRLADRGHMDDQHGLDDAVVAVS